MSEALFLRLLSFEDKDKALVEAIAATREGRLLNPIVHTVDPDSFEEVPGSPFAYWVSSNIRNKYCELSKFESEDRSVRLGLSTKNDARFVRAVWELPPSAIGKEKKWATYANGGEFSPFYYSYSIVVLAENNFAELTAYLLEKFPYLGGNAGWILHSENDYVRPCIGWPLRTHSFSPHFLPAECVFSARTYAAYVSQDSIASTVALLSSKAVDYLLKLSLGRSGHPEFVTGVVRSLPWPSQQRSQDKLTKLSLASFRAKQELDSSNEISRIFYLPALLKFDDETLDGRIFHWQQCIDRTEKQLAKHQREIDDIAFRLYGIEDVDRQAIEAMLVSIQSSSDSEESEGERVEETEAESITADHRQLTTNLLSYFVGCAFGRWDVRFAAGERRAPELPDPFAPLPVCALGALTGEDSLPLHEAPEGYPLGIDWDGILVDDPGHEDDIIRCVRNIFELLWQKRAEEIECEACKLLRVKTLRDYFRKPGNDGFWMQHVKRYSKSRRKAPIYWLLQSSKRNYALWLYYHRLDKDILFKALINYVEPKLRLEETDLEQSRSKRTAAGATGREARQLDRQIEKQEALLSELHDFHDKLRRAAELRLEPDLNDGVVLNIAPLWELVPWAEAKKYWQELLAGKYEWSSISQQLRDRKLVKVK